MLIITAPCGAQFASQSPLSGMMGGSMDSTSQGAMLADSTSHVPRELKVVKKNYNHKEQVIAGTVIMVSVIALMSFINNFNPK